MTSEVWTRDEIDSPCIQICIIDRHNKLCLGCFRSINEIKHWSTMTPDERHKVKTELPGRRGAGRRRRSKKS